MATILFDFDGTIADSFPLFVDVVRRRLGSRAVSAHAIEDLRRVPLLQAARMLGANLWNSVGLLWSVRRAMYPRMREVPVFPGIPGAIKELHAAGHKLFIISSNREASIRLFLAEHQLEPYFTGVYHCGIFGKGAAIRKLMAREHLSARHGYYIGNEPGDIEDTQSVGVRAIAVTWSGHDRAALSHALPLDMLDKPSQLIHFFAEADR